MMTNEVPKDKNNGKWVAKRTMANVVTKNKNNANEVAKQINNANEAAKQKYDGKWGC